MKFANVEGQRIEASRFLKGVCPACGAVVNAKCGDIRIKHWAHAIRASCSYAREPETLWHRTWKDRFPTEWQEIICCSETRGNHIADVRTPSGLTIEFQHSHLRPEERAAREEFYGSIGSMVWVVDGLRLIRDLPRFRKGAARLVRLKGTQEFIHLEPEKLLPKLWLDCRTPVIFDFAGVDFADVPRSLQHFLWCLLPRNSGHPARLLPFSRDEFVRWVMKGRSLHDAPQAEQDTHRTVLKPSLNEKPRSNRYVTPSGLLVTRGSKPRPPRF